MDDVGAAFCVAIYYQEGGFTGVGDAVESPDLVAVAIRWVAGRGVDVAEVAGAVDAAYPVEFAANPFAVGAFDEPGANFHMDGVGVAPSFVADDPVEREFVLEDVEVCDFHAVLDGA